jgi:protein O-GlcNAc transferase
LMKRSELGLRAEASVFWCGQSLYKYLPQYDRAFAEIAARVGDCQFLFLRHPSSQRLTELLQNRLAAAFARCNLKDSDHCLFLDRLNAHKFLGAMSLCDVFLDSIGWSGCNSTLESLACNLPIVTMRGALMRGRHSAAILQMMGIRETIAESIEDYIGIAARLANDPDYRRAQALEIDSRKHAVYCDRACIVALEGFLDRAVRHPETLATSYT